MSAPDQFFLERGMWMIRLIDLLIKNRMTIPFDIWALAYEFLEIAKSENIISHSSINRLKLFLDMRRGFRFTQEP